MEKLRKEIRQESSIRGLKEERTELTKQHTLVCPRWKEILQVSNQKKCNSSNQSKGVRFQGEIQSILFSIYIFLFT